MPLNDRDLLQAYLSARNERCPGCKYNLRDMAGEHCPECGRALALGLRERCAVGPRRGLLLALFVLLLVTGGVHSARAAHSIHFTLNPATQKTIVWTTINPPGIISGRTITVTPPPSLPPPLSVDPLTGATSSTPGGPALGRGILAPGSSGRFRLVTGGGPTWSSISWLQWVDAAWWTLVALAALGALAILIARRRPASPRLAASLVVLAWLSIAGVCVYYVVDLVAEIT